MNEKYKGDALLQKTYVNNYLEHKTMKNKGHLPQYYVENSHPHIIEKNEWEIVKAEIKRREKLGASCSGNSVFASKLICGDCGGFYGKKVWHSTDKYAKTIYRCKKKYSKTQDKCQTPTLSEQEIKDKFLVAYNRVMSDKERIIKDVEEIINLLTNTDDLDIKIAEASAKVEAIASKAEEHVRGGAIATVDQVEFIRKYKEYEEQHKQVLNAHDELLATKAEKERKVLKLSSYLQIIKDIDSSLQEWSEDIWMLMV